MEKYAQCIRAWATRRPRELLKQIEPSVGGRPVTQETGDAAVPSLSRKSVAAEAGPSVRQAKTAQRLASVSDDEFEGAVVEACDRED